mgnify:CR=1 FL=1|tara:strand:+ start:171 stop:392 length:222 start_codon:yes stop_codon:yes gene_type:complete
MNKSLIIYYEVLGFFTLIMIFLFIIVYKPINIYDRGKYLQALHPSKLNEDEIWSRERAIIELEKEKNRRRIMN